MTNDHENDIPLTIEEETRKIFEILGIPNLSVGRGNFVLQCSNNESGVNIYPGGMISS